MPKDVFYVIFNVLDNYFGIKIQKINEKTWRQNVIVYIMIDKKSGNLLGRLFLDIMYDENKKIVDPISIKLSDKMQININSKSTAEVVLLTNYQNLKCMTYNDIVLLFREFGYIMAGICYESRVGVVNYDEEFSNYLPLLMEYIAWDRDIISLIAKNHDVSIVDHIEMGRYIDMCLNIKFKCINAKFDHLLHNSEVLMDELIKNTDNANIGILETYLNIYKEFMEPYSNIFLSNIEYIDPIAIIQEINGSQGVMYANLMNEIFAYASYWIIKEKKINDFRECVLSNGVDNYRDLVRSFLKKVDVNCFVLYVKNVLKLESLDDYITEDTNYFDENEHKDESDSDKDEIIEINRIK
jgi:hypothetical protein